MANSSFHRVISALFDLLDEKQILYAILRNYETLPENPGPGNDIDILISVKAKKAYLDALAKALNSAGWAILHKIQRYRYSCYFIYENETSWPILHIDSLFSYIWKGFVWIDTESLLRNRIRDDRGFYILPPGGEAAILFLKELLADLQVKEKYQSRIKKLLKQDSENFIHSLSPYFGEELAYGMLKISLQGKWYTAFLKRKLWKRILIMQAFLRDPLRQLFRCLNFVWAHIYDRLHSSKGVFIALIGPDGVGKTTICQDLRNSMQGLFRRKIHYYHGRFSFLPELKSYYRWLPIWKGNAKKDSLRELGGIGRPRAILHLFYYSFEYFLAWPWVLLAKKRGHMLLFDRYFYNFCTQSPYRKFHRSLITILLKVIPHPDFALVLKAHPNQIIYRKAELESKEIEGQLESLKEKWLSRITRVVMVDANRPSEKVLNEVRCKVLEFIHQ